jgi:F420H(2)-dependent quinone reductase
MTKPRPAGLDRPSTVKIINGMSRFHVWLYRTTRGRLGRKWRVGSALRKGVPICLLTTVGRSSGLPRTVPVLYLADGHRIVVVASRGGLPNNPQWHYNLRAEPEVEVEIAGQRRRMRARTANPDERAALWPRLVELYHDFASYQTWTEREIPVVICEPHS